MENGWAGLKELKIELPHDPAILLIDTYPREQKQVFEQKFVHECLWWNYSQQPKGSNKLNVHW